MSSFDMFANIHTIIDQFRADRFVSESQGIYGRVDRWEMSPRLHDILKAHAEPYLVAETEPDYGLPGTPLRLWGLPIRIMEHCPVPVALVGYDATNRQTCVAVFTEDGKLAVAKLPSDHPEDRR